MRRWRDLHCAAGTGPPVVAGGSVCRSAHAFVEAVMLLAWHVAGNEVEES
ncbi:hypothetical protein ACWEQV_26865 [Rhodococcus aetherivorans]